MGSNFDLADALERLTTSGASNFEITHEKEVTRDHADQLLEDAVEAIAESSDSITDPEIFDTCCSILKYSEVVPGPVMTKLLDSITSGLAVQLDAAKRDIQSEEQQVYRAHKTPLEMYAFLLQWFAQAAEKVKGEVEPSTPVPKTRRGRGGKTGTGRATTKKKAEEWSWFGQVTPTLDLIGRLLSQLSVQRLWTTNTERDLFIGCITRPAYQVAESEVFMKSEDVKENFCKVICRAVKNHGHGNAAAILLLQRLQYDEHLAEPIAQCLAILAQEFDHSQLGDEILRDVSQRNFTAQDTKGPRIFGRFLTEFSRISSRSVLKQLSLLIDQLDSDAYPMRNAVVESMGYIIYDLAATLENGTADDPKQSGKNIKGLFTHLLQRMRDNSSYVRSKVLSVLSRLCELPGLKMSKFPQQRLNMTKSAIEALEDKTSTVRKNAVSLIIKLIRTNPYGKEEGAPLPRDDIQAEYDKLKTELGAIEERAQRSIETQEDEGAGHESTNKMKKRAERIEDDMDVDNEDGEATDQEDEDEEGDSMDVDNEGQPATTRSKLKPRKSQINLEAFNDDEAVRKLTSVETDQLRIQKKKLSDGLYFIQQIEDALGLLEQMLGSKNKSEVLEAIEFFRVAYHFQLNAKEGLSKMLHLIWSKDNNMVSEDGKEIKGVRARLLECYHEIYFNSRFEPKKIAKHMIESALYFPCVLFTLIQNSRRTFDSTLAELTSLEEMMRSMMQDPHYRVHDEVINKLWQIFKIEKRIPNLQRRGAIIILGMLALADRSILVDKVDIMLKKDLTLARYTCVALQRLAGHEKKVKGTVKQTRRFEMDNLIFRKMQNAIERPCRSKDWFGLAEQAINTIYELGQQPDAFCGDIIKQMTTRVFKPKEGLQTPPRDLNAIDEDALENPSQSTEDKGDSFELAQLLFVVGHVAIKQIAYLELVEREMKKQKDAQKAAENTQGGVQLNNKEMEELDQVAGNAEDEIGDKILEIREHEMLNGPNALLAVYGPMLVNISGSPQKFKNPVLRAAATLSLSKFLCVSPEFCEQHYRLLFRILDSSKDAGIRSNIVIALGDVAVSFSSIIDENSNELYKGLSDSEPMVKKNTLMVLTHLILNGMIKVKGQLGEMAKCVEDKDERIADLAKLFFSELSTKDNAIYNNLPDVISHLSAGEHAVTEETFQKTLKFIFTFIEKEKQAENIVEKLCQRFRLTDDPRQWRDIAFCLSLLPFKSEKSVKKLTEGLPFYRDKLHEKGVFERFQDILNKARLNKSKNDIGTDLKEFEETLEEHRRQGQDDDDLEKRAKGKKAQAKKRVVKKNIRSKPKASRLVQENDEPAD
ncbi:hypothetical protein D9757_004200 [Collybiopsis confluens]|uniref:Condensin complex subunit 1 n=1 Tax=Collybiopsis confluens TaxID=2823264 RepID=A0A8H5HU35_9AGAR|nr:hypothetical protein D9757_004200 [Collybiopsis confluens]